jgi:hypothetical protein
MAREHEGKRWGRDLNVLEQASWATLALAPGAEVFKAPHNRMQPNHDPDAPQARPPGEVCHVALIAAMDRG